MLSFQWLARHLTTIFLGVGWDMEIEGSMEGRLEMSRASCSRAGQGYDVSSRVNAREELFNPILIDRVEAFCLGG